MLIVKWGIAKLVLLRKWWLSSIRQQSHLESPFSTFIICKNNNCCTIVYLNALHIFHINNCKSLYLNNGPKIRANCKPCQWTIPKCPHAKQVVLTHCFLMCMYINNTNVRYNSKQYFTFHVFAAIGIKEFIILARMGLNKIQVIVYWVDAVLIMENLAVRESPSSLSINLHEF